MEIATSMMSQADVEEAKTQENAKLQLALQEIESKFQETKTLLTKECESTKRVIKQVPIIQEVQVVDNAVVDKLKLENDKFKAMVSSLEKKIDETEQKYVETKKLSEVLRQENSNTEYLRIALSLKL